VLLSSEHPLEKLVGISIGLVQGPGADVGIAHVGVKADQDGLERISDDRVALAVVRKTTAVTAQVLDHDPVSVSCSASLINPCLVGTAERLDVRRGRAVRASAWECLGPVAWLVERLPDNLAIAVLELVHDRKPLCEPAGAETREACQNYA